MKNLQQMMKQASEMQKKMADMQATLENHEVSGASGGGMVTLTLTGKGDMRAVKIDPSLAGDVEMLEDLILAAHKDAKAKVETFMADEMAKVTGGLNLPAGLKLPF